VEWTTIARFYRVPTAGEVIHADIAWEGPAGGGAVAAVHLAELAGECSFFTSLGADDAGRRAEEQLRALGVEVLAGPRRGRTRLATSLIDSSGERTTTTLGPRLDPAYTDPLPWCDLPGYDAVFFAAGDTGALCAARQARTLVVTSREYPLVAASGVAVDALVGSLRDPAERLGSPLGSPPALTVGTDGANGGVFATGDGPAGRYRAIPPSGPTADLYGVGDTFVAALTYALGSGKDAAAALAFAAGRGADATTWAGPFPIAEPSV
jgi:ribokinase